ncbi:MAG: type IV pilus biogenesis/stability protein PilW [Tahibacter sp.]
MLRRMSPWLLLLASTLAGCATDSLPRTGGQTSKARNAAEVQVTLGQRYLEQGKLEIALEKLQKALQYDPTFADAHTVIAVLFERIGNTREAEQHYRRAAELLPKNGAVNNNYGTYLCRTGRLDEADKYFDRAVADPFYKTPDVAYSNAGTCLLQARNFEKAETRLRRALELNSANGEALYQLAFILFQKSDFFKARAFIQRFDALGKASAEGLSLGHDIEDKLGNKREAAEYARRLRTEFPDSEQARHLESSTPS